MRGEDLPAAAWVSPLFPCVKKIDFIFFDAGGGHRAAANALKAVIEKQQRDWEIRLVNLQGILDELDVIRKLTGVSMQDGYNLMLKKGWTVGSAQLLVLTHGLIRLFHKEQVRLLREFWANGAPDLVVSLVPNFNRAMWKALRTVNRATPYVTILTDFADFPPHFWVERQEQYLICGTKKAAQQALGMGHSTERVFETSGMILRPGFYETPEMDRDTERQRLHLDPARATGVVLFGGEGSRQISDIVERVDRSGIDVQLICICGKNEKLAGSLRAMKTRIPMAVVGFTSEVPHYMRLSDFFIGKPGPGSISEALRMKLPVIVERNGRTMPQERYNTEWIREQGVGIVLPSFKAIEAGLREMLEPANLARYTAKAGAIDNQAVFEIPEILARIF